MKLVLLIQRKSKDSTAAAVLLNAGKWFEMAKNNMKILHLTGKSNLPPD